MDSAVGIQTGSSDWYNHVGNFRQFRLVLPLKCLFLIALRLVKLENSVSVY